MQNRILILYLAIFIATLILLKLLNVINFNNFQLLSYALLIYGIGLYYSSFINKLFAGIILGSAIFLAGIVFLIIGNFDIVEYDKLIIPSVILITAISLLMGYLYNNRLNILFYISLILTAAGIAYIGINIGFDFQNTFYLFVEFLKSYWVTVAILIAVAVLIRKELKGKG